MTWYAAGTIGAGRGSEVDYNKSPEARLHAVEVAGKIIVFGGGPAVSYSYTDQYGSTTTKWRPSNRVDEYTPGTNTWSQKADVPADFWRDNHTFWTAHAAVAANNTLHVLAKSNGILTTVASRHFRFIPGSNTWDSRAVHPATGHSVNPISISSGDNRIWTIGNSVGGYESNTTDIGNSYRFDDSTDTWTAIGNHAYGRGVQRRHVANTFWATSSRGSDPNSFSTPLYADIFDITTNSITQNNLSSNVMYSEFGNMTYLSGRSMYFGSPRSSSHFGPNMENRYLGGKLDGGPYLPGNGIWVGIDGTEDRYYIGGYESNLFYNTAYRWNPNLPALSAVGLGGSTIDTDLATLSATLVEAGGEWEVAQWQLARDTGFTTQLRTVNENIVGAGDYKQSGATTETIVAGSAQELYQGLWYQRARAINGLTTDPHMYSAWSSTTSFTVSHPPSAIAESPSGGQSLAYGNGNHTFTWMFSDTSPTDNQTAYQVICERNDTSAVVFDTGKVANQQARSIVQNISATLKDVLLRWRVRLWDSDDVVGVYSNYSTFRVADLPTVTITAPAPGGSVTTGAPTVTWTFTASGGRIQAKWKVDFLNSSDVVVYSSGEVTGTALTYTPPEAAIGIGTYKVRVTVTDNSFLSNSSTNTFTSSYNIPASPTFQVNTTNYSEGGYIRLTWDDSMRDSAWLRFIVYRRISGAGNPWAEVGRVITQAPNYIFDDYTAGSGVAYDYSLVQVATRFGQPVESARDNGVTASATSEYYWLVHPTNGLLNYKFQNVTADDFSDEYEISTYTLVGRGRKVEYGDRLGYKGSLTAQLRGTTTRTPRQMRLELESLRRERRYMYLRNPFGDVFMISLGDLQMGRIAGVGRTEFVDVTLPYEEVMD